MATSGEAARMAHSMSQEAAAELYPSACRANYILFLLALSVLIAFADRQVLVLLIEPIKASFGVSDTAMGALQGIALSLFYGIGALIFSRFVDERNRRNIMILSIVLWTLFSALSGLAQTYWQLFLCRIGVGLAESTVFPAAYSLIADLYEPRRRIQANLFFFAATFLGASLGLMLAGGAVDFVMQNAASLPGELGSLEGWRLAFLAVAIPGLPLALLFLTFTEPSRKEASSEASGASGTAWTYIRANYATIALLFTGLVFAEFAINATIAWSPTILIRSFSVSLSDAGVWFGGLMTAASVVSIIIASLLSRYAVPRFGETSLLPMVWVSLVVAAVALCASTFVNSYQAFMLVVGLFFVAGFVSGPFAPTLTIMVAPNQLRGRLVGLYYAYSLAVQSAAPVTIGLMSDHVFEGAGGLRTALVLTATAALSLSLACLLNTKKPLHATLARLAQKAA